MPLVVHNQNLSTVSTADDDFANQISYRILKIGNLGLANPFIEDIKLHPQRQALVFLRLYYHRCSPTQQFVIPLR